MSGGFKDAGGPKGSAGWDPDATVAAPVGSSGFKGGPSDATGDGFGAVKGDPSGGFGGTVKDAFAAVDPRSAGTEGSFTEVTRTSWFDRMKNAVAGVLMGIALIPGSAALLFWNEGRAVQTARSLTEGAGVVQIAEPGRVDPAQDGRLIYVAGPVTVTAALRDPEFGVTAAGAMRLVRSVEMYQWREESRSQTRTNLGGSQETATTYTYTRSWSSNAIDSSRFRQGEGRYNPPFRFAALNTVADDARLGVRHLTRDQIAGLGTPQPVALEGKSLQPPSGAQLVDGGVYVGRDPRNPQIGDMRIRFASVPVGPISVIARQAGDGFGPYQTQAGDRVQMVRDGIVPAAEMFQQAQDGNRMMTWILRAVGVVLMVAAFGMLFRPFSVAGSVIPLLGSVVGAGTGLAAVILTLVLAPLVIGFAWLWYRPLVGIGVLVLGFAGAAGLSWYAKQRKAKAAAQPAAG